MAAALPKSAALSTLLARPLSMTLLGMSRKLPSASLAPCFHLSRDAFSVPAPLATMRLWPQPAMAPTHNTVDGPHPGF